MTRSILAAAALLALLPAAARAQADGARDPHVAPRPAAPATVVAAPPADAAPPRPNETVVVAGAPSYARYVGGGTVIGTAVGLTVGVLAYRNNERKCEGCVGNDAIPVIVTGAGTVLGFVVGNVLWFARSTRDLPEPAPARQRPAAAGSGPAAPRRVSCGPPHPPRPMPPATPARR